MRSRTTRSYWALALSLTLVVGTLLVATSCSKPQEEPPALSAPIAPPPPPATAGDEPEPADDAAVEGDAKTESGSAAGTATGEQEAVVEISFGEEVDVTEYVVEGKTTIVDFYSEFCPPCVALAPSLHELAKSNKDINLVVVDINRPDVDGIDWESPVAQQYGLTSIPHLQVYGPDGTLQAEGDAARSKVDELLQ